MNEKFKQLALQAQMGTADFDAGSYYVATPDRMQLFAESIVRECVNKIETHQIPVGNSAAGEMACEWTYDALKEIRDEIQEHFGVEQ
jgi:hypothetical protein